MPTTGPVHAARTSRPMEWTVGGLVAILPLLLLADALWAKSPAVAAAGAVGFLFVVPGLLGTLAFRRLARTRSTAHVWSLAANTAALVVVCFVVRQTVGLRRESFAAAWLVWTFCLVGATWRPRESLAEAIDLLRRYGPATAVGLAAILAGIALLSPEQFVQCFNEDGTETYELAWSLRDHFLPYWELETWEPIPGGRMGTVVVNPSLVNSYWTCGLQLLAGGGEAATRLPYWVWWGALFVVAFRQARPGGGPWWSAVPLALLVLLAAALMTFYAGYNPYMADLANPGVPNALFTLLLLLSFDCLRVRDRWGWAATIWLASLVLYSGPVLLVLTLAAAWWWQPIERREVFRWGWLAAAGLLAAGTFYLAWGWQEGSLRWWIDTLDIEYVQHYLADVPRWISGPLFFGYFVLGSGGIAVLGLMAALRRDAWQKTVATVTLLYLLIVLGSGFKNLHWLAPIWPVPLVLFLSRRGRPDDASRALAWKTVAAAGSLLVCLVLCWPKARSTFDLNRQLGRQTTMTTDDRLAAATWARLRHVMREQGVLSWDCDEWTWVAYSELDPRPACPRPFVLTDGGPPSPEYRLLAERRVEGTATVARLYCGSPRWADWLAGQHPLGSLARYPFVFRPLAQGLFSPHENTLQDVQRLRWPWGDAPRGNVP